MSDPISTSDYLLWAYRLLLGREPEHAGSIAAWTDASRREIVERFLDSPEFLAQHSPHAWMAEKRDFWFIAELANGVRFWLRANDGPRSRAVLSGAYAPDETGFIRRYVKRGMNAVDIGADIGWFTVNMAALVGPAGHVDAFEPRPEVAHHLQRTVAENRYANVAVHRYALAGEDGYGTLVRDGDGLTRMARGELAAAAATEPVALRRLDSVVWGTVHFIRIAIGGGEKLVFDGADLILDRDRPVILSRLDDAGLGQTSQVSAADYVRIFEHRDYEVRGVLPGGRCGERLGEAEVQAAGALGRSIACVPAEKVRELT